MSAVEWVLAGLGVVAYVVVALLLLLAMEWEEQP